MGGVVGLVCIMGDVLLLAEPIAPNLALRSNYRRYRAEQFKDNEVPCNGSKGP